MDSRLIEGPRALLQRLIFPGWFSLCGRLTVTGAERLAGLRVRSSSRPATTSTGSTSWRSTARCRPRCGGSSCSSAAAGSSASTSTRRPAPPWPQRLLVAGAFYAGLPLAFPFAVVPPSGTTRAGLLETCRLLDRGFSPIIFPEGEPGPGEDGPGIEPGIGLIAAQTQVPVVPLRLIGNETIDFHPRRRPVPRDGATSGRRSGPGPDMTPEQVTRRVQEALRCLA